MSKATDWPASWKKSGWNGCLETAAQALRFLANNDRPLGGCQDFNAEHLLDTAREIELTQRELLIKPAEADEALQRELIAWRMRYPSQIYQDGVGIVSK